MKPNFWIGSGALLMSVSVALGAFGAHALKDRLSEYSLSVYQTGVHYHMIHSLGLLAFGLWLVQSGELERPWVGYAFCLGIALFSGSLYVLALTGIRGFGAITPFGGLLFILGWIMFAFQAWRA